MAIRAHGDPNPPIQSPYAWATSDFAGNIISITINFDNATRAITGVTTHRDANCQYKKILVGLGADGRPDTGHAFTCPPGDHAIQLSAFSAQGFDTIEQFLIPQITAGP